MNGNVNEVVGSRSSGDLEKTGGAQSREDRWFYVSDSHVKEVNVTQVLKSQAYILFYERIN